MRRRQDYSASRLLAYALREIERIKAMGQRISDGRYIITTAPTQAHGTDGGGSTPGPGPSPETSPHVLYGSKHTKSLKVTAGTGLNANFEEGHVMIDETYHLVAAGSIGLDDGTTNYVFVNNSGAVAKNTTGFPANAIPLAEVVTASGAVSTVTDKRAYLYGHHGPSFIGTVKLDAATELTPDAGVTIEDVLIKDGTVAIPGSGAIGDHVLQHDTTFDALTLSSPDDNFRVLGGLIGEWFWLADPLGSNKYGTFAFDADRLMIKSYDPDALGGLGDYVPTEIRAKEVRVGVDDAMQGILILYGPGAGVAEGGEARFYVGADHDASVEYYAIDAYEDYFRFHHGGDVDLYIHPDRSVEIPNGVLILSASGLTIGADVNLYRAAANTLKTDDDLVLAARLGVPNLHTSFKVMIDREAYTAQVRLRGNPTRYRADIYISDDAGLIVNAYDDTGSVYLPVVFGGSQARFPQATGSGGGLLVGGDVLWYRNAADEWRTPDNVTIDSTLKLSGTLDHDGSAIGFFGTPPASQVAAYTPSNVNADRSYDADSTTLDEIADVLGTLISDLQSYGLLP